MAAECTVDFERRPSTAAYMLGAFHRSPGLRSADDFPRLRARWRAHRVDLRELAAFTGLTGLRCDGALPLLYPHVYAFRMQMVVLTHRTFPIPIWRALQIRNHLLQHRPIPVDAKLEIETSVAGGRLLDKGAELELHTEVRARGQLLWESVVTVYYRGRFGAGGEPSPLSRAPEIPDGTAAEWRTSSGAGLRFGSLTGDFNPIHWWPWYARRLGFRGALHHPQLVIGECLARLPEAPGASAQRLDLWLKGPVYHGAEVTLRTSGSGEFALFAKGEDRPAILGRLRSGAVGGEPFAARPAGSS